MQEKPAPCQRQLPVFDVSIFTVAPAKPTAGF
jgi:hypothetical protein